MKWALWIVHGAVNSIAALERTKATNSPCCSSSRNEQRPPFPMASRDGVLAGGCSSSVLQLSDVRQIFIGDGASSALVAFLACREGHALAPLAGNTAAVPDRRSRCPSSSSGGKRRQAGKPGPSRLAPRHHADAAARPHPFEPAGRQRHPSPRSYPHS